MSRTSAAGSSASDVARDDPHRPQLPVRWDEVARTALRRTGRFVFMLRVYVLLIAMRGVIDVFSLPRITRHLGTPMEETPTEGVPADQLRYARRVGSAILRASPRTPTNSNCYPQALTAWWLLHRKRVPTTFYYGAAFDEDGSALQAHVWLRCGNLMVTGGGSQRGRFAPLTWFADVPSRGFPSPAPEGLGGALGS